MLTRISGVLMTAALFFRTIAASKCDDEGVASTPSVSITIHSVGVVDEDGPRVAVSNDSNVQVSCSVYANGQMKEMVFSPMVHEQTGVAEIYDSSGEGDKAVHEDRTLALRLSVREESKPDPLNAVSIEIQLAEVMRS